jgi:hypothetical protein
MGRKQEAAAGGRDGKEAGGSGRRQEKGRKQEAAAGGRVPASGETGFQWIKARMKAL